MTVLANKRWAVATLLVLALMTAFACSSTPAASTVDTAGVLHLPALPSYTFYIDQDVDADGRLAIAEAQRQWTEFTNVQITVLDGPLNCFDPGCFSILEVNFAAFNNLVDGSYIGYTFPTSFFSRRARRTTSCRTRPSTRWGTRWGCSIHARCRAAPMRS